MKNYNYIWIRANIIYLLILYVLPLCAQSSRSYRLTFGLNDFKLQTNNGTTKIVSDKYYLSFESNTTKPGLPLIGKSFLIENDVVIDSISYSVISKQDIGKYVIANNPKIRALGLNNSSEKQFVYPYDTTKVYPEKIAKGFTSSDMDGYRLVSSSLCPFIYDAQTRILSLATTIDVTIYTSKIKQRSTLNPLIGGNMRSIVKNTVVNPEELSTLYPEKTQARTLDANSSVRYLIVTADSLKESFTRLLEWKKNKGLTADVISIESINANYTGADLQEKIKKCLQYYYNNKYLKYVLLGGDINIVPARICTAKCLGGYHSFPSDLYFACLDETKNGCNYTFDWDADNDGVYGENEDIIDKDPEIHVSRIPMENSEQIKGYIDKLFAYEYNYDSMAKYYDKVLFGGCEALFLDSITGKSDMNIYGEMICDSEFPSAITSNKFFLYDTESNINGKTFCISDIQQTLNNGFHIINIDTHGHYNGWETMD